ncbi:hypothetical protein AAC387_Pa03g1893 [Persea americana]
MEVSGIVFRSVPCYSGAGFRQSQSKEPTKLSVFRRSCEFSDEGHLRYYGVVCKKKEKVKSKDCDETMMLKKKKGMKMIKGLSKDLSALRHMRFGGEEDLMEEEFKGKMISEAAEALLAELQVLKAEEKEMKRRRKEEKAAMKAAQMKAIGDCNNSSSSSSELSNIECGEVVDMSCLRSGVLAQDKNKIDQPQSIQVEASIDTSTQSNNTAAVPCSSSIEERNTTWVVESPSSSTCCNESSGSTISGSNSSSRNSLVVGASSSERIQVCMGGKCKKSGAVELLGEFERMIGVEGAVVGCKCMGKCRDGPNVRVLNQCNGNTLEKEVGGSITNPLCIGVGLEDVRAIVANFFGEKEDMGMMAAA